MGKEDSIINQQKEENKQEKNTQLQNTQKQEEVGSTQTLDRYAMNSKLHLIDHEQEEFTKKKQTLVEQINEHSLQGFIKNSFSFYKTNKLQILVELGAGLEVAFYQIPETVAYSLVARINPLSGIYATFFMNLFSSIFGFNGGLMSAASPAFAVLIRMFLDDEGPLEKYNYNEKIQHLFMVLIFVGIFQLIISLIKIPKMIKRLASPSAKITFYNILAVHIFISQFDLFRYCQKEEDVENFNFCLQKDLEFYNFGSAYVWIGIAYIFFMIGCMFWIPKIPYIGKLFPASIFGLIVLSIFEHHANRDGINYNQRTVGETFQLDNVFPTWEAPKQDGDIQEGYNWGFIFTYGIILCLVGIFETIETVKKLQKHNNVIIPNFGLYQESIAQSIGNLFCSLFGGMGGSGNVRSTTYDNKVFHAKGKISSFIATWVFILAALLGYEAVEKIPVSALGGVMFYNILSDFNFQSIWMILKRKITVKETCLIILGTVIGGITNIFNGTVFVIAIFGIASSWNEAEKLLIDIYYCKENIYGNPDNLKNDETQQKKVKVYKVTGKIFFSSVRNLLNSLKPDTDESEVVIDLTLSDLSDCSAVNALNDMTNRYQEKGKRLWSYGINQQSLKRISVSRGLGQKITQVPSHCLDNFLELLNIPKEKKENQGEEQQQNEEKYKEQEMKNMEDKDILQQAQDIPQDQNQNKDIVETIRKVSRKVSRKISENFTVHNMEEDHNNSMQLEQKAVQYQLQRNQDEDDVVILENNDDNKQEKKENSEIQDNVNNTNQNNSDDKVQIQEQN